MALILWLVPVFVPVSVNAQAPDAYIVVDGHNAKVFMEGNAGQRRPVGGFAAIVTAKVALDWAQRTGTDMGTRLTVPGDALAGVEVNPMGLMAGDVLTLRDLIYSMVLARDDVAASTVAFHVGRSLAMQRGVSSHPVVEFIKEMNAFGNSVGVRNTTFTSPHGGEWQGGRPGRTTPADLARITIEVMKGPEVRFYSVQKERKIAVERQGQRMEFRVRNENRLVGEENIDGLKVDMGGQSAPALIITASRPTTLQQMPDGRSLAFPHRLVVFVDGGVNPFTTAGSLLRSGWNEYDRWLAMGRPMDDGRPTLRSSRY